MSFRLSFCAAVILFVFALPLAAPAAQAGILEPLVFGSYRAGTAAKAVGAGLSLGLLGVEVVPSASYIFDRDATDWAFDVDAHFNLLPIPVVTPYAGAGYAVSRHDPKGGGVTVQRGADALVGLRIRLPGIVPFAEVAYTTAGPDAFVYTVGTRFSLSR